MVKLKLKDNKRYLVVSYIIKHIGNLRGFQQMDYFQICILAGQMNAIKTMNSMQSVVMHAMDLMNG